jgi:iron complex transport system substrate-binding protein
MSRPDYVFATATHRVTATDDPHRFRAEPGGWEFDLTRERQTVPEALLTPAFEHAVMAWVLARGERTLRLNGGERSLRPEDLDRPPRGPVQRLVSIAPSNAEIVWALDATDLLVGAESSSDFPPMLERLPRLGPDLAVDMDALAALAPDLVLASLSVPGMERNIAGLERLGIPVLVLAPQNLAEIEADILRVGRTIGRSAQARRVTQEMAAQIAELRRKQAGHTPVPVFLEWWPKPMFTPGAPCWSNEMIELAGGVNVFRDRPQQSLEVSPEEVTQADPAVIFISWCGVPREKLNTERVLKREGIQGVRAVREKHVVPIDEALLGRPGPRVLEGIRRMAEAIREAEQA